MSTAIQNVKSQVSNLKNAVNSQCPQDQKIEAAFADLDAAIAELDAPAAGPVPVPNPTPAQGFPKVMSAPGKGDRIVGNEAEWKAAAGEGYAVKA